MSDLRFLCGDAFEDERRAAPLRSTERAAVPLVDRAIVATTIALFVLMAVRVAMAWHAGTFPG
jgi:hypothetical protein